VEYSPGDSGEFVSERDRQHIAVQALVLTAVKDKPQGWPLKAASPTR
jgi:hypothetical protein